MDTESMSCLAISAIAAFLPAQDALTLAHARDDTASMCVHEICESAIFALNRKLLQVFGENVFQFKRALEESRAVIAGSIIIQCILEEYWQQSDIDIFVTHNPTSRTRSPIEMFFETTQLQYYEEMTATEGAYNFTSLANATIEKICVIRLRESAQKIHLVIIQAMEEECSAAKYVMTASDFDICRNTYSIHNDLEYLTATSLVGIIRKCVRERIDCRRDGGTCMSKSTISRFVKYKMRGFMFANPPQVAWRDIREILSDPSDEEDGCRHEESLMNDLIWCLYHKNPFWLALFDLQ